MIRSTSPAVANPRRGLSARFRWMPLVAVVAALAVVFGLGAGPTPVNGHTPVVASESLAPQASEAVAVIDAPPDAITTTLSPASGGLLAPGEPLTVRVLVQNTTSEDLPAGEVELFLDDDSIDNRFNYTRWMTPATSGFSGYVGSSLASTSVPALAANSEVAVTVEVAPDALPFGPNETFAPFGVAARYEVDASPRSEGRSVIVWNGTVDSSATSLQVIVPIALNPSITYPLDSETLVLYTSAGGLLRETLDAALGTNATLAIDPAIIASIRLLGTAAPSSALSWLDDLESAPNATFALPFADADLALQAQAGLEAALSVPELGVFANAENFIPETPEPTNEATEGATPGPSPTGSTEPSASTDPSDTTTPTPDPTESDEPTPAPSPEELIPSNEELFAFPYTFDGVLWANGLTLREADLGWLGNQGYSSLIVSGAAIVRDGGESSFTPNAAITVDGWDANASDDELTAAITDAVNASDDETWEAAMARVSALLAIVSRELPNESRSLLATTNRTSQSEPAYLAKTLEGIESLTWATLAPLNPTAASTIPDATGTIVSGEHTEEAVHVVSTLASIEARGAEISTIYETPERFTAQLRVGVLDALSCGWSERPDAWANQVQHLADRVTETEESIRIIPTSEIQLIGAEAQLPISVTNTGSETVTVQVAIRTQTGQISAGAPVTIEIPPGTNVRAMLPVEAITNGTARAEAFLLTPENVRFGISEPLIINVRAEWESFGLAIMIGGVVLLLVAGIIRTVRRRKRDRLARESGSLNISDAEG